MRSDDLYAIPVGIPVPKDDAAAAHLRGAKVPSMSLLSTAGERVDLSAYPAWTTVVFCYPRTGLPDREAPRGWNEIPGARGCTPECMRFRDLYENFRKLGCAVFGLSTQSTAYQQEMAKRLGLPFAVLSDQDLSFAQSLGLPLFEMEGQWLLKRLTMVIRGGTIAHVFYPVFPPDWHADEVLAWLRSGEAPA